jgi:hypothetical protein
MVEDLVSVLASNAELPAQFCQRLASSDNVSETVIGFGPGCLTASRGKVGVC